jgi:hypothetical protein
VRVALGVAGGYLLGRTKKMKLAMMLGGMAAGRQAGGPGQLLAQGAKLLGQSPELGRLNEEIRGRLLDAAKVAAVAVATRQVEALTERVVSRVGTTVGDAGKAVSDVGATAGKTVSGVGDTAGKTVSGVGDTAGKTVSGVGETVGVVGKTVGGLGRRQARDDVEYDEEYAEEPGGEPGEDSGGEPADLEESVDEEGSVDGEESVDDTEGTAGEGAQEEEAPAPPRRRAAMAGAGRGGRPVRGRQGRRDG